MAKPNSGGDHTKKESKVMECVCQSEFQDRRYGKGKRLHNPMKDNKWKCTCCGRKTV